MDQTIKHELSAEALSILRFWMQRMVDHENGGFYGRIDGWGRLHPEADKGIILNTRILWTFAAAARHFGYGEYREMADRAYRYLTGHFVDRRYGGVYWMLDCRGQPVADKKQIYAQAFAIYALAEHCRLTGDAQALELAVHLYRQIERYSYDERQGGYLEAFSREWELLGDLRLSDKDANEKKTMNTHLHVLEAYTNLYRAWPDAGLRRRLQGLVQLFLDRFIDPLTCHLRLFFDEAWNCRSHEVSFGHDIEAAWLMTEAAEVLAEPLLLEQVSAMAVRIARVTLAEGIDADGGIFNEAGVAGLKDDGKDWWPQAEAMVGFFNAFQLTGETVFAEAAARSWRFIRSFILDEAHGEWLWGVTRDGRPRREEDKTGPWKGPYHNTRACLEMIARMTEQVHL